MEENIDTIGRLGHRNMLFSFHFYGVEKMPLLLKWRKQYRFTMFIDSGAFSAWTAGVPIDINEYIRFLKKLKPRYCSVLDDIQDPEKTIFNQKYMEKAGLNPIPTFHLGEELKYLDWYLKRDYPYLALGGMVGAGNLETWLKGVWQHIYRIKPKLKVHGFGLTKQVHLEPYPFYSVDSSTYVDPQRFGITPLWSEGKNELYFKKHHLVDTDYKRGAPMTSETRDKAITIACKSTIEMMSHINRHQKKYGFKHLLIQQSLYDNS